MKIFIIHVWGGSPEEPIHKWLKQKLLLQEFEVIVPLMPNPEKPKISAWVSKIKEIVQNPNKEVYFVGHSIGCQAILRYLESLPQKIKIGGAVFLAPWVKLNKEGLEKEGREVIETAEPWIKTTINWNKIKSHTNKFVCIFSNNDPYVQPDNQGVFKEKLRAKIIIQENKGHFTEEDGITNAPVVLNELLKITKK